MIYESFYDEVNAELREMVKEPSGPINIGSGEDAGILFFQFKQEQARDDHAAE